ncbi:MAG: hypothetical protein IKT44_03620 [Clostridia bacterium]|nr:hypothetical protein [Clostridia bacterium]
MNAKVLEALKVVVKWLTEHPGVFLNITELMPQKKEKNSELSEELLKLDQKIDAEMFFVRKQLHIMKIMLSVMGAVLGIAVIAIVLLAIL